MSNDYIAMCITIANSSKTTVGILSLCRPTQHQAAGKSQLYATKNYFSNIIDKQEETLEKLLNMLSLCTEEKLSERCNVLYLNFSRLWVSFHLKHKGRNPVSKSGQQFLDGNEVGQIKIGASSCKMQFNLPASQVALVVKNMPASAGDARDSCLTPGSGRSPGRGNGNPLQHSCLENPMDRGAWRAMINSLTKSQT